MISDKTQLMGSKGRHGFRNAKIDATLNNETDNYKMLFAYNFVRMCKKFDISCNEVAFKLGVAPNATKSWRLGMIPRPESMKYLCLLFDCDFADFFRRD